MYVDVYVYVVNNSVYNEIRHFGRYTFPVYEMYSNIREIFILIQN